MTGSNSSAAKAESPSRFAGISRNWALLILALTAALMVASALWPMTPPNLPTVEVAVPVAAPTNAGQVAATETVTDENPDLTLYRTVIARVAAGEGYYSAIADLHRNGYFPLRPFIVFRLPTLAVVSATLGMPVVKGVLWVLLLAVVVAWWARLDGAFASPPRRIIAVVMLVFGLIFNAHPEVVVVHEVWAGLLLALSWALHRSEGGVLRWLPSVLLGLMAVLVRETALPFVLLMGAFAVWRRRWVEVTCWGAVVATFAVALGLHAGHVAAVTTLADPASSGWNSFGGWPFFVFAMRRMTQLMLMPTWLGAGLVPLTMLGWASWRSSTGLFGILLFGGYGLILMVLGRPENFYWALMVAPTFLLGLVFLPEALADLFAAARQSTQPAKIAATPRRSRQPKLAHLAAS
jgi:hypothetical protein